MTFEEYLLSKRIESDAFRKAEEALWSEWKGLFEQMHPASFTAQKLFLINPVRRKYPSKLEPVKEQLLPTTLEKKTAPEPQTEIKPAAANTGSEPQKTLTKPVVPRPVFKPKPKTD